VYWLAKQSFYPTVGLLFLDSFPAGIRAFFLVSSYDFFMYGMPFSCMVTLPLLGGNHKKKK